LVKNFPKRIHLLWIILFFICLRGSYYLLSDGFSIFKIQNTFPVTNSWQLAAPSVEQKEELQNIFKKPFSYLGKGSQVYAFASEDGAYVLKVFKCYHLSQANWLEKIPLPEPLASLRTQALEKRRKKIKDTLHSYKLASMDLVEECGIICLEILPTEGFHQEALLIDKLGRKHTIDLGSVGFIVQKRAKLIYPTLSHWIANKKLDEAKAALRSIVQLIVKRSLKGIQDSDPDLHKNAGLIGTQAVFIDMGSFHQNELAKTKEVYVRDLYKITNKLYEWLRKQSPELAAYLKAQINEAE
jgi:hypothetical protein